MHDIIAILYTRSNYLTFTLRSSFIIGLTDKIWLDLSRQSLIHAGAFKPYFSFYTTNITSRTSDYYELNMTMTHIRNAHSIIIPGLKRSSSCMINNLMQQQKQPNIVMTLTNKILKLFGNDSFSYSHGSSLMLNMSIAAFILVSWFSSQASFH